LFFPSEKPGEAEGKKKNEKKKRAPLPSPNSLERENVNEETFFPPTSLRGKDTENRGVKKKKEMDERLHCVRSQKGGSRGHRAYLGH